MNNHYDIANLPDSDLRDIFQLVGKEMNLSPALIEKDFWVSFLLKYLYQDSPWKEHLLFKGGTCLSKCYGVIQRFSEDIDLLLDWRVLGYSISGPEIEETRKKQERSNESLMERTVNFVKEIMCPKMKDDLKKIFAKDFELICAGSDLLFKYPNMFESPNVKSEILMEIGPRGIWGESNEVMVTSYISQRLPELSDERISVNALALDRTLCEKMLILHTVASRGKVPDRYSRHYYDVFSIYKSDKFPIVNPDLIEETAKFKSRFFPGSTYGYDSARLGTLKLSPPKEVYQDLEKDYQWMSVMIFGIPPSFDTVMNGLDELEKEINSIR